LNLRVEGQYKPGVVISKRKSGLHAEQHDLPLRPVADVAPSQYVGRVLNQLLEPALDGVLWRPMLMIGHEKRHHVAADAGVHGFNAREGVGPYAGGDGHGAGRDGHLVGVALPVAVGASDRDKLPELVRARWPS
jgi:hypothetical protein